MLRSLGSNVQRTIRPRTCPYLVRIHPRFTPIHHTARFALYSTTPLSTTTKTTTKESPLPTTSSSSKPRVELSPKPIKLAPKPVGRSIPPVPPAPTPSALNALEKEFQSIEPSAMKTAKNDIIEATHGVFAPPPEGAGKLATLWHTAKEFFRFYWNGIKLINQHRKEWALIDARVKSGGPPLTWRENLFGATYRKDVLKMVPFLIIVMVLEEVIPLIAIYAPGMLPSTCILPSQRERITTKADERQVKWWTDNRDTFKRLSTAGIAPQVGIPSEGAKPLAGLLRLSAWGPSSLNARRVRKHLEWVVKDDVLLREANAKGDLKIDEKRAILNTRGFVTTGFGDKEISAGVDWWLKKVDGGGSPEQEVARRLKALLELGARPAKVQK